ncbi:hypothetical protein Sjap_005950 [Stephania japonica]|uniref:Uncharacterized protein n=1 Tax=Stephania japonica TaxID=461633 RepID=A0AAP0PJA3_9MAGN
METQAGKCVLDESTYSSPVPLIGLYITPATLKLVRIASILAPTYKQSSSLIVKEFETYRSSLLSSLDEVFEILHFVDKKMSSSSFENEKKLMLAMAFWRSGSFNIFLPKIVRHEEQQILKNPTFELDQAIDLVNGLQKVLHTDYVREELVLMIDFILGRDYGSLSDLHNYIERLYIDMVKEFLGQLPNAIFKDIKESNAED